MTLGVALMDFFRNLTVLASAVFHGGYVKFIILKNKLKLNNHLRNTFLMVAHQTGQCGVSSI